MKHIEYEERVMLTINDYLRVIDDVKNYGRPFAKFSILNIYLDNDNSFIFNHKMMLRIRKINNKEELTLKVKEKDNSSLEINETTTHHQTIDKYLEGNFDDYKEVSRLKTERIEVNYGSYLLVIDKNEYHNIIDYDLEIESNSQEKSLKIIKDYCLKYNLKFDENYKSKSHRAITKAREIKNGVR